MLVLSRKENEWIHIGPDVSICIVKIRGGKVHVGIDAPMDFRINRREVTLAIVKRMSDSAEAESMPTPEVL